MDFPINTQKLRRWFLDMAEEVHADHQMIYLNLSDEHSKEELFQLDDGWTFATEKSYVAQVEHTIILTKNGPIILTL